MLVTNLEQLVEYCKTAPLCDGVNHEWVKDEDVAGELYCRDCYVIQEEPDDDK